MADTQHTTPIAPDASLDEDRPANAADYAALTFESDGGEMWNAVKGSGAHESFPTHWPWLSSCARLLDMDHHQVRAACRAEPEAMMELFRAVRPTREMFAAAVDLLEAGEIRVLAGLAWVAAEPAPA